jgi:hypothetical protein
VQVDITLIELADRLKCEHGASFAPSTIWLEMSVQERLIRYRPVCAYCVEKVG